MVNPLSKSPDYLHSGDDCSATSLVQRQSHALPRPLPCRAKCNEPPTEFEIICEKQTELIAKLEKNATDGAPERRAVGLSLARRRAVQLLPKQRSKCFVPENHEAKEKMEDLLEGFMYKPYAQRGRRKWSLYSKTRSRGES